jgi:polysaccharide deacetylase family protein (PEP-CTERM system associated)
MNLLTFDIEEWFHILDNSSTKSIESWKSYETRIYSNMERIFEILYECGDQKATFFCLGWVAEKYPDIIRKIQKLGHEIGSHSYAHQLVYEQDPKSFKEDLIKSIEVLEDILGDKVKSYRSPGFSITNKCLWAFEILIENGIEVDCSIFPAKRAHGGLDKFDHSSPFILKTSSGILKEFPMNVTKILNQKVVFSGGGYFRLFPFSFINSKMKNSEYVMTYFHPRDFDAEQPIIDDLSSKRKFKSYYGLKGSSRKMKKLIASHSFLTLGQANERVNWEEVDRVEI